MRKITILLAAAFVCLPSVAQNINQSVEVSNDYLGRIGDVRKQEVPMMVPDTLLHFDYAFDYSVFETPYKGAYDFSPYLVNVTPQRSKETGRKLYLRAGAGFSFHPELDFAYVVADGDTLSLSVYNRGSGYAGKYVAPVTTMTDINGYDLWDEMGVNGHIRMDGAVFTFGGGWDGLFTKGYTARSAYNSGFAQARLKSTAAGGTFFYYDFGLKYRYAKDALGGNAYIGENDFMLGGTLGQVIKSKYRLLLDMEVEHDGLSITAYDSYPSSTLLGAVPHLLFTFGKLDIKAGARFDYVISPYGKRFRVKPDVKGSLSFNSGKFVLEGGLTGGQRLNTYSELKHRNHFFTRPDLYTPPTLESWNFFAGFRGSAGKNFEYRVKGGYASLYDAPFDSWYVFAFDAARVAYADAGFSWKKEGFELLGNASYCHTAFRNPGDKYVPAPFSGDVKATRSIYDRISCSLEVEWASRRDAPSTTAYPSIPGYADISFIGEYVLSSGLGAWVKLGNMACMEIQKTPGYICKGPYFTAGIALNL